MKDRIKPFAQFLTASDLDEPGLSDLERQELAGLGLVKRLDGTDEITEAIEAEICLDPELQRLGDLFTARLKELFAKFRANHVWDDDEMSRVDEEWSEYRMEDNTSIIDFAVSHMLWNM